MFYIEKEKMMTKTKLLAGLLLIFALLAVQVGIAAAAPLAQDTTPLTGTIQSVTTETDTDGVTTVLVTLIDEQGATQTVRISLAYAVELGLIDPTTQEPIPLDELTEDVTIDANEVIPDEEPAEESFHPIAWLLAEFFGEEPSVVDGYHEDGFGFGVIAQALWISQSFTEDGTADATLAEQILAAKKSGEYDNITLSDGTVFEWPDGNVPANWGQFKKALRENKEKHNLGVIVSGQADDGTEDALNAQDHGNGKNKKDKKVKNPHKP
jgi:hypothetical protein